MSKRGFLTMFVMIGLLLATLAGSGVSMARPLGAAEGMAAGPGRVGSEAPAVPSLAEPQQLAALLDAHLLAKAEPDECFNGPGVPYTGTVPICEYGVPKVNQAYVWGLAKPGDELWFGTAPNTHCLVFGSYLGITSTIQTESYVCEFGDSQYSPPLPAAAGDWRPPDLFVYDLQTRTLSELAPADPRLGTTVGIRSAGTLDGVVILGGPGLLGGLNLFAFEAGTRAYLGSTNLPQYDNIRKWVVVDGVLYTGVRDAATGGGHVLRWRGSLADPFQFEVVANLGSEVAELTEHDGSLYVTTWPNLSASPVEPAGLFMSPPIPAGGLTAAEADAWTRVWQASDYEPDPVTAVTYGGGALYSYGGDLYWGTMHVPFVALRAHFQVYGVPEDSLEIVSAVMGTHRAISIFRGRNLGTLNQEIDLLYGSALLPVYYPTLGIWLSLPNNMGSLPLWGAAGFGNFYNNYTWTMDEFGGQLYVGTMDYSYILDEGLPLLKEALGIPPDLVIPLPASDHGADLWRFPSAGEAAVAESIDGVGNPSTYGIRTMIAADGLYLGMANPMNLLTDLDDDLPEGGWELLRLSLPPGEVIYLPLVLRAVP